jgi:hypothetical protein
MAAPLEFERDRDQWIDVAEGTNVREDNTHVAENPGMEC